MGDDKRILKHRMIAGVLIVLALAIVPGRLVYRHFKEKHGVAQAQAFFARGDYSNAWLSVRQALLVNSNNVEACFIMAELNDAAHSAGTLDWCKRLVALSPTVTNKLLLASAALRYQDPPYPLASQVLGDISKSAAGMTAFHIISAEMDLNLHHLAEAEAEYEAAGRLEPTNQMFPLNVAVIRLDSTNTATAEGSRARLIQFSADKNLGPTALRALTADRLQHKDAAGALNYSTQLLSSGQPTVSDRLQNLDILKVLQNPSLAVQLAALQRDAATNATMAAQTAGWMEANGFLADTVGWLSALSTNIQTQNPVRLAFVDCYLNTTNWTALRQFTSGGDWGEMDFLRLAFTSRALTELGNPVMADGHWQSAVSAAGERVSALAALLELANRWKMPREQEDLLWRILREYPDARWAQAGLEQLYFKAGNTAGLYQLYLKQQPYYPTNDLLKNNLAATALLLKTNLPQAHQWVAEAYARNTNNPVVVATFAYSLHLQGRDQEGLAAFGHLKPAQLEDPAAALYYGLLLSATGHSDQAAPYLQIAQSRGQLLPEEKQLLSATGN